jgi:hypothetical protein
MERRGSVRFQQLTLMLPAARKEAGTGIKKPVDLRPQAEKRARFNLGVSFREKLTDGA